MVLKDIILIALYFNIANKFDIIKNYTITILFEHINLINRMSHLNYIYNLIFL